MHSRTLLPPAWRVKGAHGGYGLPDVRGHLSETTITCPYCGREWRITGGATGFVLNAAKQHIRYCEHRTPAERRQCRERDRRRYKRKPGPARISFPDHRGLEE